jgi:hypothetical protein
MPVQNPSAEVVPTYFRSGSRDFRETLQSPYKQWAGSGSQWGLEVVPNPLLWETLQCRMAIDDEVVPCLTPTGEVSVPGHSLPGIGRTPRGRETFLMADSAEGCRIHVSPEDRGVAISTHPWDCRNSMALWYSSTARRCGRDGNRLQSPRPVMSSRRDGHKSIRWQSRGLGNRGLKIYEAFEISQLAHSQEWESRIVNSPR